MFELRAKCARKNTKFIKYARIASKVNRKLIWLRMSVKSIKIVKLIRSYPQNSLHHSFFSKKLWSFSFHIYSTTYLPQYYSCSRTKHTKAYTEYQLKKQQERGRERESGKAKKEEMTLEWFVAAKKWHDVS